MPDVAYRSSEMMATNLSIFLRLAVSRIRQNEVYQNKEKKNDNGIQLIETIRIH